MPAARKPKTKAVAKKRKAALTPKKAETPKGKTQDVIQLKRAENDAKKRKQQAEPEFKPEPPAPATDEAPAQVAGAVVETLKQKATRIKVELRLGEDVTTIGDILRAANEAMGLTPNCLTLPQQASRLLGEIGI